MAKEITLIDISSRVETPMYITAPGRDAARLADPPVDSDHVAIAPARLAASPGFDVRVRASVCVFLMVELVGLRWVVDWIVQFRIGDMTFRRSDRSVPSCQVRFFPDLEVENV